MLATGRTTEAVASLTEAARLLALSQSLIHLTPTLVDPGEVRGRRSRDARLLIVTSGSLARLPFAALPVLAPTGAPGPLLDSAASMMMRFYTGLDTGRSAGAALRDAQLRLAGADPYATSRDWAAIVLMGTLTAGRASMAGLVPLVVVVLLLLLLLLALALMLVASGRSGASRQ